MSNVVKNVRKGDEWEVGGELRVKAGGKLILETGAEIEGLPIAAKVNEAAGDAPTAAEFKALLDSLKAAGIMANA